MRLFLAGVLFSVVALQLAAQEPLGAVAGGAYPGSSPESGSKELATGTLTGHVTCDDTRAPARNALVIVAKIKDASRPDANAGFSDMVMTHAGSDGAYRLEHLPVGEYAVFATLPGYLSDMDEIIAIDPNLGASSNLQKTLFARGSTSIRSGSVATSNQLLHRGAALSGRVLYGDGVPAVGVSLVIEDATAKPITGKEEQALQIGRAVAGGFFKRQNPQTDDQGRFRIAGLPSGRYYLACTENLSNVDVSNGRLDESALSIFGIADPRSLKIYAGNTVHRQAAKTYTVRAGDDVSGIEMFLPLEAFHDLRGSIVAKDGRAINEGEVKLQDTTDDQLTFTSYVTDDGTFVLQQVPPGTYTLSVSNARVGVHADQPSGLPERFRSFVPQSAFADSSMSVLVKDSEVDGLNFVLSEVPLPKTSEEVQQDR